MMGTEQAFVYKVFNMSEVDTRNRLAIKEDKEKITWLDLLNEYGGQGWEIVMKLTKSSYLMKKRTR